MEIVKIVIMEKQQFLKKEIKRMKTQIRRGVFETNSSSTHSLQLAKQTLDEARKVVSKRIYDKYS